jgi:MFS family permease
MKLALFKPFELNKWFIVGFNAFLAGLLGGHNGGNGSRAGDGDDLRFGEFLRLPQRGWEWLMDHPGWFIGILFALFFVICLVILLTWLSSRGTFMFIDSVALNRAEIAKPWREKSMEGNSLFVWRLLFGLLTMVGIILIFAVFFSGASYLYHTVHSGHVPVFFIVIMVLVLLLFFIIAGYISLFLTGFVAPLQFKHSLTTTQAWGRFLPIFSKHVFQFILFGFVWFILNFAVIMVIIFAGLMTCCIGILIMIIPYIGTVATLPIWYTLRAFSLEYLAQFGPEYDLFPEPVAEAIPEAV